MFSPGRAIFGSLLAVKKEYFKSGLGIYLLVKGVAELRQHGVRFMVASSTNPITEKMLMKLGASRMKEEEITRNGRTAKAVLLVNEIEDMIKRYKPKL